MKTYLNVSKLTALISMMGVLAAGGLAGGCASSQNHDSTGEYVDDTGITTRVKTALLRDDNVKSFEISVKTMKGLVQLSGFVDNADQKAEAGHDAAACAGVTGVENDLIVKPPQ
jgi:hyperosmotically inducible periplasmic protein